jgi:Fur family ferric uptake transcriptional regulator
MIDHKTYKEIVESFNAYLTEKKMRKTEERYAILDGVCSFPKPFDIGSLHQKLQDSKFTVSKSTLYNTMELLIDAGIIIRHQVSAASVLYELRIMAETHIHFICTQCGCMRETKNTLVKNSLNVSKTNFSMEFFLVYVYGQCGRCKNKAQKKTVKNQYKK